MAELFIYRTYGASKNGDPITEELVEAAEKERLNKKASILAKLTGLSASTVSNLIIHRKTRFPRHSTIAALYGALGFSLEPKRTNKFDLDTEMADAKKWQLQRERQKIAAATRSSRKGNGNRASA